MEENKKEHISKVATQKQLMDVKEIRCVSKEKEVSNLKNEKWILIETVSTNEGFQYVMGRI